MKGLRHTISNQEEERKNSLVNGEIEMRERRGNRLEIGYTCWIVARGGEGN